MDHQRGASPSKTQANFDSSPEQLLDAFKAAALSVTKLYKTSAAAQTKSRSEGYQECLDDLLAFLDKENIGLADGEGWRIRSWATERLDGREVVSQSIESEDEEKPEQVSSPETHRASSAAILPSIRNETSNTSRNDSAPPQTTVRASSPMAEESQITVPTQENFTFQSSHPYPNESALNLANLNLSDSRNTDNSGNGTTIPVSRPTRPRHRGTGPRPNQRSANHLGRGAGQKRRLNFAEIFDLGSLGFPKDMFGGNGGGKRSRHA